MQISLFQLMISQKEEEEEKKGIIQSTSSKTMINYDEITNLYKQNKTKETKSISKKKKKTECLYDLYHLAL